MLTVFCLATIIQLYMEQNRGRGKFEGTYAVLCYSTAPLLVAWVPWLGPFSYFYMAVLFFLGVREMHDI